MKRKININPKELAVLVIAALPPTKYEFLNDTLNNILTHHYKKLTPEDRTEIFNIVTQHPKFDIANYNHLLFYNMFNPDNQYSVLYSTISGDQIINCFRHEGEYFYTPERFPLKKDQIISTAKMVVTD